MYVGHHKTNPHHAMAAVGSSALSVGNVVMWGTCARPLTVLQLTRYVVDISKPKINCRPPQILRGGKYAPNMWHFVLLLLLAAVFSPPSHRFHGVHASST